MFTSLTRILILPLSLPSQDSDKLPHYDSLKNMLSTGRPIPVKLDLLAQLESRYAAAKAWVDRAGRTFLKKNPSSSLLEVHMMSMLDCI